MHTCVSSLVVLALSALPAIAQADDAHTLIERAIAAQGGAANLDRASATLTHTMGTISAGGASLSFTGETRFERPDHYRQTIDLKGSDGKVVSVTTVYNGRTGWIKRDGRVDDLEARQLEETRETVYLTHLLRLTCLRERAYELTSLGESADNGRSVLGVRVSARGFRSVDLFFDKNTSLLVKTRRRAVWKGNEFTEERVLSDYKEVEGVRSAKKAEITRDGAPFMTVEILDVRYLAAFGDNTFDRP